LGGSDSSGTPSEIRARVESSFAASAIAAAVGKGIEPISAAEVPAASTTASSLASGIARRSVAAENDS